MLTEEAFLRHPRPQAAYVPTHGALIRQRTQTTEIPQETQHDERSVLRVDTSSVTSKKRHLPSPSPTGPTKAINLTISPTDSKIPIDPTRLPPASPPPAHLASTKRAVRRFSPVRAQHSSSSLSTVRGYALHPAEAVLHAQDGLPWERLRRLGALVQGSPEHLVCVTKEEPQRMTMVKTRSRSGGGLKEAGELRKFSHPNITEILEAFVHGNNVYIELEYCRFTLEELINVRIRLEEPHLGLIAHSIFAAIRHISAHHVVHGNINAQTTRVCGQSMVIKLADFDHATHFEETMPNTDLEQLGLLLLQCMDQSVGKHTDVQYVRQQRAVHKVFGLDQPELWSGAKQFIDFLDDLFSESRSAVAKVDKPHPYIREDVPCPSLLPYLELVTLESFVLWQGAQ